MSLQVGLEIEKSLFWAVLLYKAYKKFQKIYGNKIIEPIGLKELSAAQMIGHASVLIALKLSARNTRHRLPPATLMGIRTPDRANDKKRVICTSQQPPACCTRAAFQG